MDSSDCAYTMALVATGLSSVLRTALVPRTATRASYMQRAAGHGNLRDGAVRAAFQHQPHAPLFGRTGRLPQPSQLTPVPMPSPLAPAPACPHHLLCLTSASHLTQGTSILWAGFVVWMDKHCPACH